MDTVDLVVLCLYFAGVTIFGAWLGRFTTSTKDFFMAGQRFPAWLVAFSCVATLVGSYSFVKYSAAGFSYGIPSSQTYLNDWFWMPLWMFGWLPILYFGGIVTVPEFFTRRFDSRVRVAATFILLLYLIGYIGINLYTIGTAMEGLLDLPEGRYTVLIAAGVAALCMAYEFTGGQTSVIFTDLLQGILLLLAGLLLFGLGIYALGGFDAFWQQLPEGQGRPLPPFNEDPKFNFIGIFWQDGLAGGLAFYFMNQGMLLRFLSARSAATARRAAGVVILVLMPLTAIAVAGAGWIASALVEGCDLPHDLDPKHAFVEVSRLLCAPGVFGMVIAALLAALMSTADTLINASSSILVNDIYRPFIAKHREDRHYLKAARWTSLCAAAVGVGLVPLYMSFGSIYEAHGAFTAAITPPMAVAIFLAFLWPRFNTQGALATLVGGIGLMSLSVFFPVLIQPFSHGIDPEGGYKYIRACYGVAVSLVLGIGVTLFTRPPDPEAIKGLTLWTCRQFFSSRPARGRRPRKLRTTVSSLDQAEGAEEAEETDEAGRAIGLALSEEQCETLCVKAGDLVFVDDARWWLGGLRSARCQVEVQGQVSGEPARDILLPVAVLEKNGWQAGQKVVIARID